MRSPTRVLALSLLLGSIVLVACSTRGSNEAALAGAVPVPSVSPSMGLCRPAAGGPYWLTETETVSFTAACATGNTAATLTIANLPAGASFDGHAFSFTPGLDQAAVYHLQLQSPSTGETSEVLVGVADKFWDSHDVPVLDPATYESEYGVPVFFLSTEPTSSSAYSAIQVVYGGHTYSVDARIRGVTTLAYPKKSYLLKFPKSDKFSDPAHFSDTKRRICITTTFDDNSDLRHRLAYTLWARMDPRHIKLESYDAVVYVNGKFHGLYEVSDRVDGNLMQDNGLLDTANLYEAKGHEANWSMVYGTSAKLSPHDGFDKQEGAPAAGQPGAWDDLDALVTWVATASDSDFHAHAADHLDVEDYEDWWIFTTFMLADDNVDKNSFHYHDAVAGTPFRYCPWDFNAAFGQNFQTTREGPHEMHDYRVDNHLFARLLDDGTYAQQIRDRFAATLDGPWAKDDLTAVVDQYSAEIEQVALRDQRMWGDAYRNWPDWNTRNDFNDHDGEVEYVRSWIRSRWDFARTHYATH